MEWLNAHWGCQSQLLLPQTDTLTPQPPLRERQPKCGCPDAAAVCVRRVPSLAPVLIVCVLSFPCSRTCTDRLLDLDHNSLGGTLSTSLCALPHLECALNSDHMCAGSKCQRLRCPALQTAECGGQSLRRDGAAVFTGSRCKFTTVSGLVTCVDESRTQSTWSIVSCGQCAVTDSVLHTARNQLVFTEPTPLPLTPSNPGQVRVLWIGWHISASVAVNSGVASGVPTAAGPSGTSVWAVVAVCMTLLIWAIILSSRNLQSACRRTRSTVP